jgi:hypothetical protein
MSKEYLNYLEHYLKVLSRKSKSIVLVGDFNHDLHSNNGNNLKILMEGQNFISYQKQPDLHYEKFKNLHRCRLLQQ